MTQILYSFPPGTGGDHVCAMLLNQPLRLRGRRAQAGCSVKHQEHLVRSGQAPMSLYLAELARLRQNQIPIVTSHATDMPGTQGMLRVRAVWRDVDLTWRLICRDLCTNDWIKDIVPYLDTRVLGWLTDQATSTRRRLLRFIQHQHRHGVWCEGETIPTGWIRFDIDRLFEAGFVDDVGALADLLEINLDFELATANHAQWRELNEPAHFTLSRTVRHLEQQQVLGVL